MTCLRVLFVLTCIGAAAAGTAQPFSAYVNARQEFYAFDNGAINRLETWTPVEFKVGRNAIAYLDNSRTFKVYHEGQITPITDLFTTQFEVSDHLILFRNANSISVVDGSEIVNLSRLCDRYALGDSLVMFYDNYTSTFNSYYKGKITPLESFLALKNTDFTFDSTVKVSDNIGAYINYNEQFKVFYDNDVETLENQAVNSFDVGRNTVAYVDINNQFKIFHKGKTYTVDPFAPESYMVGDDVVAFICNDGNFKIFYEGNLYTIGYYKPRYKVKDRVVAFEDPNGFFKAFYEGEQYQIDSYYPDKYTVSYNSLVYLNKLNTLRMFSKGKVYDITSISLQDMRLDYDVLQFKVGYNSIKLFYNGEYYN